MTRLFLPMAILLACAPAFAQNPAPTNEQKLHYLGNYALALGRKIGCDGNRSAMVMDIERFTYVLQVDPSISKDAQDLTKKNIADGIAQAKAKQVDCGSASQGAEDVVNEARLDLPLMQAAAHTVAIVSGAAIACNRPKEEVEPLLKAAILYTHTAPDQSVAQGLGEGGAQAKSGQVACDAALKIFAQVKSIFVPQ